MLVERVGTRAFRNLADATTELAPGLTVLAGPNGAGKTNLLEALFFGLTGRSPRTRRERELIRFGETMARSEVALVPGPGEEGEPARMLSSISATEGRHRRIDGRPLAAEDERRRPAVSLFMPDRLALVKGPPSPRRAHLDRVAAAVWPARAGARRGYGEALAQRNALLARLKRGGDPGTLEPWDAALAGAAVELVAARAASAELLAEPFVIAAGELGLEGEASLTYRPRTDELDRDEIRVELERRREADRRRGYSAWGPHLDEIVLARDGRELRRYGSQGEQRLGLLALLFAERAALGEARRSLPVMLLDDVMSELDPDRRSRLVDLLDGGQALVTTTEADHVPRSERVWEIEAGVVGKSSG
ncbi:MAG: DNA replication/repair protein RecF [Solirubrobacterales bacterium]